jgi:hypothetical protein
LPRVFARSAVAFKKAVIATRGCFKPWEIICFVNGRRLIRRIIRQLMSCFGEKSTLDGHPNQEFYLPGFVSEDSAKSGATTDRTAMEFDVAWVC